MQWRLERKDKIRWSVPVIQYLTVWVVSKSQYIRREGIIKEVLQGNFLDLQDVNFEIQKKPTECLAWELKSDPTNAIFYEITDTQRKRGGLKSWHAAMSLLSSAELGTLRQTPWANCFQTVRAVADCLIFQDWKACCLTSVS